MPLASRSPSQAPPSQFRDTCGTRPTRCPTPGHVQSGHPRKGSVARTSLDLWRARHTLVTVSDTGPRPAATWPNERLPWLRRRQHHGVLTWDSARDDLGDALAAHRDAVQDVGRL